MADWDYLGFGYAFIVALGGVIGFLKAGSLPSLAAGVGFGLVAAAGAYQTSVQPSNIVVTLCTSAVLAAFMGLRFYNSGKLFPAGIVCVLSVFMVLRSVLRYRATI